MALFSLDDGQPGTPDHTMQQVLDATLALGQKPLETLTPEEARRQPLPADGAKEVMKGRGLDPAADLGVETRDFTIPGPGGEIQARLYTRKGETEAKPIVVYWHGGGWVIAGLDDYDATPRALTLASDCVFISCHYRQGPEDKFPAAHEDAWAAYRWVVENAASLGGDPARIAVAGESAGGNLALNVSIRARDEGVQAPEAQLLVYPVAGNDMENESYRENEFAKPLSKALVQWMVGHYLNDLSDAADPRINLVAADLANLPDTTIIAAEIDPLRTEGKLLAERLEAAGNTVGYHCYNGAAHEFFGMGLIVKDAAVAQTVAVAALKKGLKHGILGKIAAALA